MSGKKEPCILCGDKATRHYPGFVYEDVCDYCHDQPTLWFPDKPIRSIPNQTNIDDFFRKPRATDKISSPTVAPEKVKP